MGETLCSDAAVGEDCLRQQEQSPEKSLAGAVFVWRLTLDAVGGTIPGIFVMRCARGKAPHAVLFRGPELGRIPVGLGLRVTAVASDPHRRRLTLLGPPWPALLDLSLCVLAG